jgi:hypothetical protein
MAKGKRAIRLIVSTLLGFVFGIICWLGTKYGAISKVSVDLAMALGIIFNRALIGFSIGISGLKKLNYLLHGVIIGLVVTLPLSIYPLLGKQFLGFIILEVAGAIWGLLIELIVVKVFKAPID